MRQIRFGGRQDARRAGLRDRWPARRAQRVGELLVALGEPEEGEAWLERARLVHRDLGARARIRDAIEHIRAVLPDLAAHLDRTVHTGIACRYDPESH